MQAQEGTDVYFMLLTNTTWDFKAFVTYWSQESNQEHVQWWDRLCRPGHSQGLVTVLACWWGAHLMLPLGVLPEGLSCSIPLVASLSRLCPACRSIPPCVCGVPKWRYDTHIHSSCLPNSVPSHLHSYFFQIPVRLSIIMFAYQSTAKHIPFIHC